jgi:hypothetical protein
MLLSQFECDVIVRVASEYFPIFYSNNNKIISNKISQLISNLIVGIILRLNILNEAQMKRDLFYCIIDFLGRILKISRF